MGTDAEIKANKSRLGCCQCVRGGLSIIQIESHLRGPQPPLLKLLQCHNADVPLHRRIPGPLYRLTCRSGHAFIPPSHASRHISRRASQLVSSHVTLHDTTIGKRSSRHNRKSSSTCRTAGMLHVNPLSSADLSHRCVTLLPDMFHTNTGSAEDW